MKKQIVIAAGLAVLSTSAFATKARLEALGQDNGGSHYIQDTRSIFRNAAHVNNFKNYVVTEWGTAAATAETLTAPHAEGGFFREMGSFAYGLYMGNEANAQNTMRAGGAGFGGTGAYGAAALVAHDNALDLFFGGDMGVQWGANVHYASNSNEPGGAALKREQSALGLGLGMIMGDLTASVNLGLSDESKEDGATAGTKFDNTGMEVNFGYGLGDLQLFAEYDKDTVKFTNGTGVAEIKTERTELVVGLAKTHEVSSTARITAAVAYSSVNGKDTPATGTATEVKNTNLPVTLTFETEANSWLTLRGSASQSVLINSTETVTATTTKLTNADTTAVNAGATLSFGKLKVDGSIGAGTGAAKAGVLTLNTAMARVGVHYWF
ncbi:MAG: hypothetical protein HN576_10710 [Bacteriovoracaceae bacterium]|jgi:hypothetical protein|nr:hypothetical protein [Bacteriovoracaceae bacterium]